MLRKRRQNKIGKKDNTKIETADGCKGKLLYRQQSKLAEINVQTYKKLIYPEVWDGIDVEYLGYMDKLEYRVIVKPYSNPENIIMSTGAEKLTLSEDGSLIAELKGGKVIIGKPYAYQIIDGKKVEVPIEFKILENGKYTFEIGYYDKRKTLIIDPIIVWSTLLGGSSGQNGLGIAVDSSGNV